MPDSAPTPPPKSPKVYASHKRPDLDLKYQLGEDFAAIRDIYERLNQKLKSGRSSSALDVICRNLKQCCDQMKYYDPHLPEDQA